VIRSGRPSERGARAGGAWATPVIVAVLATLCTVSCGVLPGGGSSAASPTAAAAPPPQASQAPGPPLATASATPSSSPRAVDPASVAAYCFRVWQSYDTRTDAGPGAGLLAARSCMTPAFYTSLGGGVTATDDVGASPAWLELKAQHTYSRVDVLAVGPLGGVNTAYTGRVVLLLNVRRTTVADTGAPIVGVSTPTLTLLRQPDGGWLVSGADLTDSSGDAPGGG
jgi:hypothetical protein